MSARTIADKFVTFTARFPKLTCLVAGSISALAMAPTFWWPMLMIGLSAFVVVMGHTQKPIQGAWRTFIFGMGFFTFGLYWVANALLMKLEDYWWAMVFSILGLPLLLSLLWFVAGWISIRFSRPGSLARATLLLTLLAVAEYGRAFNLTGFPWNLFAYTWGSNLPVMQIASIGGAYLLTLLTMFWMATPALAWTVRARKRACLGVVAVCAASFVAAFAYGALRTSSHPTVLRTDAATLIVQPNITQDEKWETDKTVEHFMRHITIMEKGLASIAPDPALKSVAVVWPETSLEEQLLLGVPAVPKAVVDQMSGKPFAVALVSGLWREQENKIPGDRQKANYYNSVAILSLDGAGELKLDDLYDKHHLVPFGEFLPMEQLLDLTPLVGFAGFRWGDGPKVLHSPATPPVAPMICFEAIFPWYAHSHGADWLVNTSNDGWYGNAPGPYQHLTMTRFRAVEQGKPISRAATTGISAVIDSYGRIIQSLPYEDQGSIFSYLPKTSDTPTIYSQFRESVFFLMIVLCVGFYILFRHKDI